MNRTITLTGRSEQGIHYIHNVSIKREDGTTYEYVATFEASGHGEFWIDELEHDPAWNQPGEEWTEEDYDFMTVELLVACGEGPKTLREPFTWELTDLVSKFREYYG